MSKKAIRLLAAILLILCGIGLQFVSHQREKTVGQYQPVTAVIEEFYQRYGNRAQAYTRMRVSYTISGQEYQCEIQEPFIVERSEGSEWKIYYLEDSPEEAISSTQLEMLRKKAPVPMLIGWVMIGISVAMILWHGTDLMPEWRRPNTDEQRPNPLYTGRIEVYRSDPAYEAMPKLGLKYLIDKWKHI